MTHPSCLNLGVTGHRALPDDPDFLDGVEQVMTALIAVAPTKLTIVSALAEGADRLIAERILREPSARLVGILPLRPDDYEDDFATAASRDVFRNLLKRADEIVIAGSDESRRASYEAAGIAMLARIDRLIALWDGQAARGRGGTAEIVARALSGGVPVLWMSTVAPYPVTELEPERAREAPR